MEKIHSTVLALSTKHYLRKWFGRFDKKHNDLYERFEQNMIEGASRHKKDTVMGYIISLVSKMDPYTICEVINYAFTWSDTTEGHEYWSQINDEWCSVELPRFYKSMPESMTSPIRG